MIKPFQSLRFFAIVAVFLSHLGYLKQTNYKYYYDRYFNDGYFGVIFFILLSGVVISYNYFEKIDKCNINSMILFAKKRIKRIYPVHVITLIASIPISFEIILHSPLKAIVKFLLNIVLLQSFIPNDNVYFSFNSISWFLSTILFCYFITPILFKVVKTIMANNINLWFVIIASYMFEFLLVTLFRNNAHAHWIFYISPFFRAIDYFIGITLGVIILNKKENANDTINFTVIELFSLGLFLVGYYFYPYISQSFRYGVFYMPFIMLIIYIFSHQRGYISKILSNKKLIYLGNISFEFYMVHRIILTVISDRFGIKFPILTAIISFVFALIIGSVLNKILSKNHIPIKNIIITQ